MSKNLFYYNEFFTAIQLLDKIAFSGNNRFNSLPESFACPNQMILVHIDALRGCLLVSRLTTPHSYII